LGLGGCRQKARQALTAHLQTYAEYKRMPRTGGLWAGLCASREGPKKAAPFTETACD